MNVALTQTDSGPGLASDPRWELAERIAASATFIKSPRLCSILLYVCELSLQGRSDEISEVSIGATVFGRAPDYDPSIDGIVRSHASRLRQRLEQYFAEEGAGEAMRLTIPRGGYVPLFEEIARPQAVEEVQPIRRSAPAAESADRERKADALNRRLLWTLSIALVLACTCIVFLLSTTRARTAGQQEPRGQNALWSGFFSPDHPALVICSDTSLTILENLTGKNVSLADYLSGDYRTRIDQPPGTSIETAQILAGHRYTSIVDTEIVSRLYGIAGNSGAGIRVRYSRDVRPNDLKDNPVILLGTKEGTPWVELFEPQMNFRIVHNHHWGDFSVLNRSPRGTELARYDSDQQDPGRTIYGLVALRPNLEGSGRVLILEGTSMAGTESAADFVLDDSRLLPFLKKIRKPNGELPWFEVLLRSSNMNGNASQSQIVGYRVEPD